MGRRYMHEPVHFGLFAETYLTQRPLLAVTFNIWSSSFLSILNGSP